ncbi:hypothetical protein F5Y19DRAFT_469041 [Xylariaceae sp. FL1651]|nr:hypothetical protein F5Y19DRAFT_469041 [Xylariaceae sp. FL1651]
MDRLHMLNDSSCPQSEVPDIIDVEPPSPLPQPTGNPLVSTNAPAASQIFVPGPQPHPSSHVGAYPPGNRAVMGEGFTQLQQLQHQIQCERYFEHFDRVAWEQCQQSPQFQAWARQNQLQQFQQHAGLRGAQMQHQQFGQALQHYQQAYQSRAQQRQTRINQHQLQIEQHVRAQMQQQHQQRQQYQQHLQQQQQYFAQVARQRPALGALPMFAGGYQQPGATTGLGNVTVQQAPNIGAAAASVHSDEEEEEEEEEDNDDAYDAPSTPSTLSSGSSIVYISSNASSPLTNGGGDNDNSSNNRHADAANGNDNGEDGVIDRTNAARSRSAGVDVRNSLRVGRDGTFQLGPQWRVPASSDTARSRAGPEFGHASIWSVHSGLGAGGATEQHPFHGRAHGQGDNREDDVTIREDLAPTDVSMSGALGPSFA